MMSAFAIKLGCRPISLLRTAALCRHQSNSAGNLDISGIYPPIPTPFTADLSIAYDQLGENFQKWSEIPFRGYVVQGSNGEYPLLTSPERIDLVKFVKKYVGANQILIAGSGCESTQATVELSNKMADNGADAVLVITPAYYKTQMTADILHQHFTTVADNASVPVILYNMPGNTGIDIPIDVVASLAKHPNIIGVKDSGGNITRIGQICQLTKNDDFQMIAGSAGFLLPSYCIGAVGGVCALANVLGKEVCQLHSLHASGDWSSAKNLQLRLIAPNTAITAKYGVAGLKAAMEMFGFYGGPPRPPLQGLPPHQAEDVRNIFKEFLG